MMIHFYTVLESYVKFALSEDSVNYIYHQDVTVCARPISYTTNEAKMPHNNI